MQKRLEGLYTDSDPVDTPKGRYTDALNASINDSVGSIVSERGNYNVDSLPNGYYPIGDLLLSDQRVVIFSTNNSSSEIGILSDDRYETIINNNKLGFNTSHPIKATSRIDEHNNTIIYWTDGNNPPRFYNVDTKPEITRVENHNIFNNIEDVATVTLDAVNNFGGSLQSGAYQFSIRYTDISGNRTNFLSTTRPINIVRGNQRGDGFIQGNKLAATGKSITLSIDNLDLSYDKIQIAVIQYEEGTSRVSLIEPIGFSEESIKYTFTGNESLIDGSIDEILINDANYDTAKTLTQADNTLYLGNITRKNTINYQPYANNIRTRLITKNLDDAWSHGDPNTIYLNTSYRREDVYAFYIAFKMEDGSTSPAFHIPGRESELHTPSGPVDPDDPPEIAASGSIRFIESNEWEPQPGFVRVHYEDADPVEYHYDADADIYSVITGVRDAVNARSDINITCDISDMDTLIFEEKRVGSEYNGNIVQVIMSYPNHIIMDGPSGDSESITLSGGQGGGGNGGGGSDPESYDETEQLRPDSLNSNERTASTIDPDSKFFHFFSKAGSNGLGYWENLNETYPNTDDFLVRDIDGTVVGDLRGKKVRHHRFPSYEDQPLVRQPFLGNPRPTALGIRLENVKIPPHIAERVRGVEIYYAKKNDSDRLVLDQGIPLANELSNGLSKLRLNVGPNSNFSGEFDTFCMHPFSTLNKEGGVASVSYLKKNANIRLTDRTVLGTRMRLDLHNQEPVTIDGRDHIIPLKAIAVTPSHLDEVQITQHGFTNNKSSDCEVSAVHVETEPINLTYNTISATGEFSCLASMMQLNKEVCAPFDQQRLVSTGRVYTNISNLVNGSHVIDNIFGGDTYINFYGRRVTTKRSSDSYAKHAHFSVHESYDNIAYRQTGDDYGQINGNDVSRWGTLVMLEDGDEFDGDDVWYDNYFSLDESHSVDGSLIATIPYPKRFIETTDYPTRVIRSQGGDSSIDNFRLFLEADHLDMPRNRGEITNLDVLHNTLIIHTTRALYRTRGREEITTGDFRAFLGTGDIFQVDPDEIFSTEGGFAGLQDFRHSLSTPAGYFFIDQISRKVYMLADTINDISNLGMRNFFRDNLLWYVDSKKLLRDVPQIGIFLTYDDVESRILMSKVDYEPIGVEWDQDSLSFRDGSSTVELGDPNYFNNHSFTISFLPETQSWISFHSYTPSYYTRTSNDFYSFNNNGIWKHKGNPCEFYGTVYSFEYEFVDNTEASINKLLQNVEYITYAYNEDGSLDYKTTFDKIRVSNELQDSGEVDLVYFTDPNGNIRNIKQTWKVNRFRDIVDPETGLIDNNLPYYRKKKFSGKYARIRLYYTPISNKTLKLIGTQCNYRLYHR